MINNEKDLSIEELADIDWLSVRAINICQKFGLLTLNQILAFYHENGSFLKLRNCGQKTEDELIELCEKYKEQSVPFVSGKLDPYVIINELNPLKRATLNRHIEYLMSNLSVRAVKGIRNISESGSLKEILEMIYDPNFQFNKFQNIGNKTIEELLNFKLKISYFLNHLPTLKNAELSKEYAKLIVKTTFRDLPDNFEAEFERVSEPSGRIKLFRLIAFLIESDQLFNKNEKRIFTSIYSTNIAEEEELGIIAEDLNLTRERVRQLKSLLKEDILSRLHFISNFTSDDFINYEIENLSSFKVVDDTFADKIRLNEEVYFNTHFCSIILGLFLRKSHSVLGDNETINGKRSLKSKKKYKCCYIISNNLFDVFEFEQFVEDVYSQLNQRITETYSLHFEGFLLQFLVKDQRKWLKEIIPVCETIILNEFDLVVNFEGFLLFERNTKKQLHEYALEVLEASGSLMKVEDVCSTINEKYPNLETTESSIRATLQREKELFIYFGRSSTYGLKRWEYEKEDIKGGTIRDIIEEYLKSEAEPKHVTEILEYLQKFRSSNSRSILTNIKLDESGRFRIFKRGYIGLNKRQYNTSLIDLKNDVKTWEEKFEELKLFRKSNPYIWPRSSSVDKSERLLYVFCYKTRSKHLKGTLNNEREKLLRSIGFPLDDKTSRRLVWDDVFEKLEEFVNTHNYFPRANSYSKDERALNRFCYMNKKSFHKNELSIDRIEKLNKLKFNFNFLK
jgi:hypothetical protein